MSLFFLLFLSCFFRYTCVTTKSIHNLCSSFFRRESKKIKYATDEDYADRVCNGREVDDRRDSELDENFHRTIEFDEEEINLENCCHHHHHHDRRCSSSYSDDAQIEDHCDHCPDHECDCTDDEHQELDEFDGVEVDVTCPGSYKRRDHEANILVMHTPHLSGMIV